MAECTGLLNKLGSTFTAVRKKPKGMTMRYVLILALASVILSGCGGDKKVAKEALERQLGESRNVKVHEVFDGGISKYSPGYTYLCGLVTYDQDNGTPIKGKTPFMIEKDSSGGTSAWIAPYSASGSDIFKAQAINTQCGHYYRQSGQWKKTW